MLRAREAYEAWKEVNNQAKALGLELEVAWDLFLAGAGLPPSEDLMREVSRLQTTATVHLGYLRMRMHALRKEVEEDDGAPEAEH